jgi:hypothetical protein
MNRQPISVWRFYDAPEEYRKLSDNGGDEDWLALVPPGYEDEYIGWLDSGRGFGACEVSMHKLENGYTVYIGAHS